MIGQAEDPAYPRNATRWVISTNCSQQCPRISLYYHIFWRSVVNTQTIERTTFVFSFRDEIVAGNISEANPYLYRKICLLYKHILISSKIIRIYAAYTERHVLMFGIYESTRRTHTHPTRIYAIIRIQDQRQYVYEKKITYERIF